MAPLGGILASLPAGDPMAQCQGVHSVTDEVGVEPPLVHMVWDGLGEADLSIPPARLHAPGSSIRYALGLGVHLPVHGAGQAGDEMLVHFATDEFEYRYSQVFLPGRPEEDAPVKHTHSG